MSPVLFYGGGLGKYTAFVDFLILSYLCRLVIRQTIWYDCHNFQQKKKEIVAFLENLNFKLAINMLVTTFAIQKIESNRKNSEDFFVKIK